MRLLRLASSVRALLLPLVMYASQITPSAAQTSPANTINEMFALLYKCWRPPVGSSGFEATLRFSVSAKGAIIGKPMITHSKLGSDENINKEFMASVLKSVEACAPVAITPALGGAVAGRPLAMLFRSVGGQAVSNEFPTRLTERLL